MRAELSPFPTLNPCSLPSKPSRSIVNFSPQNTHKQNFQKTRKFAILEPPWLISTPPHTPSHSGPGLIFDHHQANQSGIPLSLRLVQLKRKKEKLSLTTLINPTERGSIANAVWALTSSLENLQKSALSFDDNEVLIRVSRESQCSVVWLFQRVFSSSPEIALGLLVMTTDFMVGSLEGFICSIGSMIFESEEKEYNRRDGLCGGYVKTKIAYEQMIVTGEMNSMILSNYAQFLYQYEKDFNRANDYFNLAINTEPVDSEAMSRYAVFLWRARGDNERAEEMFQQAMQVDPENSYHRSVYVWFLNETGAPDTCDPLSDCNVDEEADEDEEILSS